MNRDDFWWALISGAVLFLLCLAVMQREPAYALDDVTIPYSFSDSGIIYASEHNANFDSLEAKHNALNDSVDNNFIRFTDLTSLDSTLARVSITTLRNLDTLRGNPYVDSAKVLYADVQKGDFDSVKIGAGAWLYDYASGSCGCTLYDIVTIEDTGTCLYEKIGNIVLFSFPADLSTNLGSTGYIHSAMPASLIPTEDQDVPICVYSGGAPQAGFVRITGTTGVFTLKLYNGGNLSGATSGFSKKSTIKYLLP